MRGELGAYLGRRWPTSSREKAEIKNLVGKNFSGKLNKLVQKQKGYYEESLGGVPGGERVPVVEGGREKRVAIRTVGPSWNSRIVCTCEREGYAI